MPEFWVFGYGSLMWKPGFAYLDSEPALLRGLHRRLCVFSHVHRGTPERPGLVLGLDRGGSCHGMAFRVGPEHRDATLDYLRAREQVTMVYLEQVKPITLIASGRRVDAVTYVVDRSHRQYAGRLDDAQLAELVRQGEGQSGACHDYVRNTVAHLRDMQIHDAGLERLMRRLDA